jgi:adenylate cyclase
VSTVVFADLVGSTSLYESLGDATASRFVSQLVTALSKTFELHHGRVVKLLGDGLFVLFPSEADGLAACVALQQSLQENPVYPPLASTATAAPTAAPIAMTAVQMQLGMESGEVVEIAGDCFGDAVNTAARLADLAGGGQIWTTAQVRSALPGALRGLLHSLGPLFLRGKTDATEVFRVQWREETEGEVTVMGAAIAAPMHSGRLSLRLHSAHSNPQGHAFVLESPHGRANIGRAMHTAEAIDAEKTIVVSDARVSRLHCNIAWRGAHWVLSDVSSFGTWVYVGEQVRGVALRRSECQLVGSGYISLGCERTTDAAPMVRYQSL